MKNIYQLTLGILPVALASCSAITRTYQDAIPVGTIITLNQEIRIPDNRFSVRIQNGEIRPYSRINQYYPNCEIVVKATGENYRIVKPDRFLVTKVNYEEMVQNRNTIAVSRHGFIDGQTFEPYTTILYLYSKTQPHVYSLECSHWEIISEAEHLTLQQMQSAMGKIFTIGNKNNLQ